MSGLLPHKACPIDEQVEMVLYNLRKKPTDMERYFFLTSLQDQNKTLFYRVLIDNIEDLMPVVYTPTVGQACLEYAHIFRRPRGIYITPDDRGRIGDVLGNWHRKDISIGTGDLAVAAMMDEGLSKEEARQHCWFVDSKGLVVKSRSDFTGHKLDYAHDHPQITDFLTAVETLKPTAIIGVSGQPKRFDQAVIEAMARIFDQPIIFALSNPTSKAECTAEVAYTWSDGRAIFASGSPFD